MNAFSALTDEFQLREDKSDAIETFFDFLTATLHMRERLRNNYEGSTVM